MSKNSVKKTEPQKVQELVKDLDVFTDGKTVFVELPSNTARRAIVVNGGSSFVSWFEREYGTKYGKYPPRSSTSGAVAEISSKAVSSGNHQYINFRYAKDGKDIFIDLCDPGSNDQIKVNKHGWDVVQSSNVIFGLESHFLPIDRDMVRGGDPLKLFKYITVTNKYDQVLILTWMCHSLRSEECPILHLKGSQASGKTTAAERLRTLFDPAKPLSMSINSNLGDLALSFFKNPVCFFDNISGINPNIADMFCKAVTGDGYSKRQLYSNSGLVHYDYKRPIIITSIVYPSKRNDFLSRSLVISMNSINPSKMVEGSKIEKEFYKDLPSIRGGILDLLVKALNRKDSIKIHQKTRMGDYDQLALAVAYELDVDPDKFMQYRLNTGNRLIQNTCNESVFFETLVELIQDAGGAIKESPQTITDELNKRLVADGYPEITSHSIGHKLQRYQDVVECLGIRFSKGKSKGAMYYHFELTVSGATSVVTYPKCCNKCLNQNFIKDEGYFCSLRGIEIKRDVSHVIKCKNFEFNEKEFHIESIPDETEIDEFKADILDMDALYGVPEEDELEENSLVDDDSDPDIPDDYESVFDDMV